MERIQRAGQHMRSQRPSIPSPAHGYDQHDIPQPGDPNEDSPEMRGYRQESMRPLLEDGQGHGGDGYGGGFDDEDDLMDGQGYGGGDEPDYGGGGGSYEEDAYSGAPPDLSNMNADEMMGAIETWLETDPSRKAEVMQRLPQLTSLLS